MIISTAMGAMFGYYGSLMMGMSGLVISRTFLERPLHVQTREIPVSFRAAGRVGAEPGFFIKFFSFMIVWGGGPSIGMVCEGHHIVPR